MRLRMGKYTSGCSSAAVSLAWSAPHRRRRPDVQQLDEIGRRVERSVQLYVDRRASGGAKGADGGQQQQRCQAGLPKERHYGYRGWQRSGIGRKGVVLVWCWSWSDLA